MKKWILLLALCFMVANTLTFGWFFIAAYIGDYTYTIDINYFGEAPLELIFYIISTAFIICIIPSFVRMIKNEA
jgi:hypothetical protein